MPSTCFAHALMASFNPLQHLLWLWWESHRQRKIWLHKKVTETALSLFKELSTSSENIHTSEVNFSHISLKFCFILLWSVFFSFIIEYQSSIIRLQITAIQALSKLVCGASLLIQSSVVRKSLVNWNHLRRKVNQFRW